MATIPSKPLGEFIAHPDRHDKPADVVHFDGMMAIDAASAQGFIYISKAQAMAFFDLIPRYNPDEEMGANDTEWMERSGSTYHADPYNYIPPVNGMSSELERLRWLRQQEEDGYSTTG